MLMGGLGGLGLTFDGLPFLFSLHSFFALFLCLLSSSSPVSASLDGVSGWREKGELRNDTNVRSFHMSRERFGKAFAWKIAYHTRSRKGENLYIYI